MEFTGVFLEMQIPKELVRWRAKQSEPFKVNGPITKSAALGALAKSKVNSKAKSKMNSKTMSKVPLKLRAARPPSAYPYFF
jgi:hypothetical protein